MAGMMLLSDGMVIRSASMRPFTNTLDAVKAVNGPRHEIYCI